MERDELMRELGSILAKLDILVEEVRGLREDRVNIQEKFAKVDKKLVLLSLGGVFLLGSAEGVAFLQQFFLN